jgi:hypothetical protein
MTEIAVMKDSLAEVTPWLEKGQKLAESVKRTAWEIGDWWNAGAKYGEKQILAATYFDDVYNYDRLRKLGSVAGKFEMFRRRNISITHHEEVAALPAADQDRFLDQAEANKWSVRDLRAAVKAERENAGPQPEPESQDDYDQPEPPDINVYAESLNRDLARILHPDNDSRSKELVKLIEHREHLRPVVKSDLVSMLKIVGKRFNDFAEQLEMTSNG